MSANHPQVELVTQAERAASTISDPELRRIAFESILKSQSTPHTQASLDTLAKLVQVLAVVIGVVVSVLSYRSARESEAAARASELAAKELDAKKYNDQRNDDAIKRQAEAAKPFLELRQKLYQEAVQAAGILANPTTHSKEEVDKAKKRFRELYVAELSLVEGIDVEQGMVGLAETVDPELTTLTPEQKAAYRLAHRLRDSLVTSWGITEKIVDNPNK